MRFSVRTYLASMLAAAIVCGVVAHGQTRPADQARFDFGVPVDFPSPVQVNATSTRVVELLGEALAKNPVTPRRVELVRDLGETHLSPALPHIVRAMDDPEPAVRFEAARAAAALGDVSVIPQLRKLLADADADVRCSAVRAGSSLGDASFVLAGLADADESVFVLACGLASTDEHDRRIAERMSQVAGDSRIAAIRALGRRRAERFATLVETALDDPDIVVVSAAIRSLAQMNAVQTREHVRALVHHPNPTIRRCAVTAMASLADAADQSAVGRQMLADPDLSVREAAARLLAAHPSADTVPALFEQLGAGYRPLNAAAREALVAAGSIPNAGVSQLSAGLLNDADPRRREDGSFILGRLRSDAGFDRHLKLLEDADWKTVAQAALSLSEIGRADARPAILRLASQVGQADQSRSLAPDQTLAIGCAFIACGRLHCGEALPLIKQIIPQKMTCPIEIRGRAIWAAGVLGSNTDDDLASKLLTVYRDNSPFESEQARIEAIKALGNMRYMAQLDDFRKQGQENPLASLRFLSHEVADRLSGQTTLYAPPRTSVIADTSIQVLDR